MSGEALVHTRIMEVLLSPAAKGIDFWGADMHIDASGFAAVQFALYSGAISVSVEPLKPNANAMYDRGRDKFLVRDYRFGRAPDQRAALLHEAVHAISDIRNIFWKTYSEDEAVAYIAQMLFYRYDTGRDPATDVANVGLKLSPFEEKANNIAGTIVNQKGAMVSRDDIWQLRNLVMADPGYSDVDIWDLSGANGVT